jgi:hypothetical protein
VKRSMRVPTCCERARSSGAVEVINVVPQSDEPGNTTVRGHADGPGCVRFTLRSPGGDVVVRVNRCPFCGCYLPGTDWARRGLP